MRCGSRSAGKIPARQRAEVPLPGVCAGREQPAGVGDPVPPHVGRLQVQQHDARLGLITHLTELGECDWEAFFTAGNEMPGRFLRDSMLKWSHQELGDEPGGMEDESEPPGPLIHSSDWPPLILPWAPWQAVDCRRRCTAQACANKLNSWF